MDLSIPDMSCNHCRAAVTRAVQELDPAARVEVDLETRRAKVTTSASATAVIAVLETVGFPATVA